MIINEIVVEVEEPPRPSETTAEAAESKPPQVLTPQDIRNFIRHHMERLARIRAH
jgi:hypothetical protein